MVSLDEHGRSNFQKLQNNLKFKSKNMNSTFFYYVFDILYLNGEDLRHKPLIERKNILKTILKKSNSNIKYSDHIASNGNRFYKLSCQKKLEGIVSKKSNSKYLSGRSSLWIKTKCHHRQEFVIGGYTDPIGNRKGFGALLLGIYVNGKLQYTGKVGTGFNHKSLLDIKKEFINLEQSISPFKISSPEEKNIHWLKPIKVAEISFANWTVDGLLRTPVFLGLRDDKKAKEIHMENPEVILTSPDKILFKKEKISKKDIARYYNSVSKAMLPYITDRPLSLFRCPEGPEKNCFYQKHIQGTIPKAFHTIVIQEKNDKGIYLTVNSSDGLEELVQINAFELHIWNCRKQSILNPDQIVMDLDPGSNVSWTEIIKAAFILKKMLQKLKLHSFVKLTGGKGLHIHIPISPQYSWDQIKNFSLMLAKEMAMMNPLLYTANMAKKERQGKIFIDYLRNSYGSTSVAPYSLRAKPISSVALPIEWNELRYTTSSNQYSLDKTLKKLKRRRIDPWKKMIGLKQKIPVDYTYAQ